MVIKEYFVIKTVGMYLLLLPLIPVVLIMMLIFSKAFETRSQIPEDLDEQVNSANKK